MSRRRAVGLIRVSKIGGRTDDFISPLLQRHAIEEYAAKRGVDVIDWVEALDESGGQRRSPWWRRLDAAVAAVEEGRYDAILVWKFSRAARLRKQWAVALDRVEAAGGVIESATEQLDTTTSTGRLARGMLAELAAWESERASEVWRETHRHRIRAGLPATGKPRWGYTYDRASGFTPDPAYQDWIVGAYERYAEGATFRSVAMWLAAEGALTTGGRPWTSQGLRQWMDSGFAAGLLWHQGEHHRGAHTPMVDAALWARYQQSRARSAAETSWSRNPVTPLSGLVRCGVCGGPMCKSALPELKSRGLLYPYRFRCCVRADSGDAVCTNRSVAGQVVFDAVVEWLRPLARDVDAAAEAAAGHREEQAATRAQERRLARELDRLDEALARLAVQEALLPSAAYGQARDELLGRRSGVSGRLLRVRDDMSRSVRPGPRVARSLLGSWDVMVREDPAGLREVLRSLIRQVTVTSRPGELAVRVIPRWESASPPAGDDERSP